MTTSSEGRPSTPTLDKVIEVREQSTVIGDFLDWLPTQGYTICRLGRHGTFYPCSGPDVLLHEYFEIDPDMEERERRAVLDYVRRGLA